MSDSEIRDDGFTVSRTFAAPPTVLWDVWTQPEQFAVWFGTHEVAVPLDTLELDVREGGRLRAVMHLPDGSLIHWRGQYREVDPPRRLVFTLTDVPGEDPDDEPGEPIVVDFVGQGEATRVTLFQPRHGFDDAQIRATIDGYSAFFDTMETQLSA